MADTYAYIAFAGYCRRIILSVPESARQEIIQLIDGWLKE